MAHYRKIDSRIQNDEKFCHLSDDGQLVFLLILTHPHLTALGAMRGSIPGLASEKRWTEKRYRKAFLEAAVQGMVRYDEQASMIWLPNFLKYNHPESPNVVRSWGASLELIPECKLKQTLCLHVKAFVKDLPSAFGLALPKGFGKDFDEDLPKTMPNQEQEQEQEQEQDPLSSFGDTHAPDERPSDPEDSVYVWPKRSRKVPADFPRTPTSAMVAFVEQESPGIDLTRQHNKFLDWEFKDAHNDWHAAWRNWMREAFDRMGRQTPNGARASPQTGSLRQAGLQQFLQGNPSQEPV